MTTKTTHRRRLPAWLIPLAIVIALLALSFRPRSTEVDLQSVQKGPMQVCIVEEGETHVRERYQISAPLAGRLLRMGLEAGDEVCENSVLATIDPAPPQLLDPRARAQAKAMVGAAKASIERAITQQDSRRVQRDQLEKAYRRNAVLHQKRSLSDAALEASEAAWQASEQAWKAAGLEANMARFDLELAEAALLRVSTEPEKTSDDWTFDIRSPIDGVLLRIHDKSSRMVQSGTPLLDLGDPDDLQIRIDVLSSDAVRIRPGQRVLIEHWGGGKTLLARVRRIEPSAFTKVSALGVDEQRVYVFADFEGGADTSGLGDGYRVEAQIVVWERDDIIQVPAGALFRDGSKWAVYQAVEDRAQLVHVELGRNNGETAEVLEGLGSGDHVILHPGDRVTGGTRIKPRS